MNDNMDESERSDVMKTRIAEEAATERLRIEAIEGTKRAIVNSDNYQFVRGLAVVGLVFVAGMASCVGYRYVDAWETVNKPPMPTKVATMAPARASAAASAAPKGSE